jgi:hypothetical protein
VIIASPPIKKKCTLFKNIALIVDNGIENRTTNLNQLLSTENIGKDTSQLNIKAANSMLESIIKELKYW